MKDITGTRFGLRTAVRFAGVDGDGREIWKFRCDCGKTGTTQARVLRRTHSCGCAFRTRGGNSSNGAVAEYRSWRGMLDRCFDPGDRSFPNYGGRGITVCQRWRDSFESFLADMGPRPGPGLTIERVDVNGNYEPGNCRWATRAEQTRNTRRSRLFTLNGETLCLTDWARRIGVDHAVVRNRLLRGWPVSRALTERPRKEIP